MFNMMKWSMVAIVMIVLISCSKDQEISTLSISYLFNESEAGWAGDFADYPEGDSIAYGLLFKHDTIQDISTSKGLRLSGNNGSDDLFMFIKKKVSGLLPNTTYDVLFNIKVASNAPTGSIGIGGAPGESVFLKVGATLIEPKKELETGSYKMNIDKGNQSAEGSDMMNLGNIGVSAGTTKFTVITRNNSSSNSFVITTDTTGEIWLIVGSDSGFEGLTTLYYTQIDVLLNAVD